MQANSEWDFLSPSLSAQLIDRDLLALPRIGGRDRDIAPTETCTRCTSGAFKAIVISIKHYTY